MIRNLLAAIGLMSVLGSLSAPAFGEPKVAPAIDHLSISKVGQMLDLLKPIREAREKADSATGKTYGSLDESEEEADRRVCLVVGFSDTKICDDVYEYIMVLLKGYDDEKQRFVNPRTLIEARIKQVESGDLPDSDKVILISEYKEILNDCPQEIPQDHIDLMNTFGRYMFAEYLETEG